jgi:hypothetical protein
MNTVSAPYGIAAPVKMRIASPASSATSGRLPAVSRPATLSLVSALADRSA